MEVYVPIFREGERSTIGATVVRVAETQDPVDGVRRIEPRDARLREVGAQVVQQGLSYAGETNLSVVILGEPVPVNVGFTERPA